MRMGDGAGVFASQGVERPMPSWAIALAALYCSCRRGALILAYGAKALAEQGCLFLARDGTREEGS